MAVTKLSNSGIKTGVLKYDSMLAGNAAYDPAATWLIQRVAGTGSATTITFSSIPQTYQHLQLRIMARSTYAGATTTPYIKFNSDSSFIYTAHQLKGNGTAASATGATSQWLEFGSMTGNTATASTMGVAIIDIHDYKSTTKNKTVRISNGYDVNGSGIVYLNSGLWPSTSAITSITIEDGAGNWTTSSTFALYGFKG